MNGEMNSDGTKLELLDTNLNDDVLFIEPGRIQVTLQVRNQGFLVEYKTANGADPTPRQNC